MKIAIAQVNNTIGTFSENLEKVHRLYMKAADLGADLVIFPELCLTGYPPQDLLERRDFVEQQEAAFRRLVQLTSEVGLVIGHISKNPAPGEKPLFSSVSLIQNGTVVHTSHKRLLPTYDVFDERRYFEPGRESLPVDFKGLRIGLTVCEDIWTDQHICPECRYNVDPARELSMKGIDLLVNVSASPFHLGKLQQRRGIAAHITNEIKCPLIYVNSVGGQDCLVFDGASFAMDPSGEVFAQLPLFKEELTTIELDKREGPTCQLLDQEAPLAIEALKLALRDYMKRSGFKDVVVGLSGGIDSSVTATIAKEAIGGEHVLGVIMPSRFTSKESIEDAEELAANLGIETLTIPIKEVFNAYLTTLSPFFEGRPWDVTEENIQARIRGNLLMAISNKFGHLVLSTGNKSELAVGYCTLYGDLSGGFALISDCPKTLVYEMARYLNQKKSLIPERVLKKPPSAELRPGQKDQDELPPYDLLDKVLRAYVEDGYTRDEIVAMGVEREVVDQVVARLIKSEYKRRQAPIGPRITKKALCCGRRWPVCHGFRG